MFARSVQLAIVALALITGGQAKAAAIIYGTYYDDQLVGPTFCNNGTTCRVNFSQLPSDRLLQLSKINCLIQSSQPLTAVLVGVSATSGGPSIGRGLWVNPGPGVQGGGTAFWYSFETDARLLIGQARFPFALANTAVSAGSITMQCGIVGDLVTPIQ
jgi:hypothetical protein